MRNLILFLILQYCLSCGETDGLAVSPDSDSTSSVKRVFISSSTFNGNLGGLAGADAQCGSLASAAGLGGTWVAYLSTTTENAIDHIVDVSPWYFVNESTLVFSTKNQLLTGPTVALDMDENGTTVSGSSFVWTGSNSTGQYHSTYGGCSNWSSSSAGVNGVFGARTQTTAAWQSAGYSGCSGTRYIYCFEQ